MGKTGHAIYIEHLDDGGVTVRVIYPDGRRQRDIYILRVVCCCFCLVPVLAWIFSRGSATAWWIVIGSTIFASYGLINSLRQFLTITRSYVFRADSTGLTIQTSRGRHERAQHFAQGQVADIVLKFSFHNGPNSLFRCWLVIATPSSKIRCLQNLGGDHLARIANALRAALGMTARTWP